MADIDLKRPIIKNPDGSFSTERTITIEADGKHYLLPTIVGGKQVDSDTAVQLWRAGKNAHVGEFGSAGEAETAAVARSREVGKVRGKEMADNDPLAELPAPAQAQAIFSNPAFLKEMALTAAQNRDPAMFKWLEQAHTAAKEGAFEAVGHLMAGNPQEAMAVWNRTGQLRDVVNVNQNKDGTYSINRKDGSTVTLDPVKEYKRLLSPREFIAAQQHEAELADRQKRYQLEDRRHAETLAETRRYHDAVIGGQAEDRVNRYDLGRAGVLARMSGGSRGTSSRSGGDEQGPAGQPPRLKPKEILDAYEKAREEALKKAEADPKIDVNGEALRLLAIKTARLSPNDVTGQWSVQVGSPSGQYSPIAEFDSMQEAAAAMQALVRGGVLPAQGRLARDDRREGGPGESTESYQTPPGAPAPRAAAGRRALPQQSFLDSSGQTAVTQMAAPAMQAELERKRREEEERARAFGGGFIPMGK